MDPDGLFAYGEDSLVIGCPFEAAVNVVQEFQMEHHIRELDLSPIGQEYDRIIEEELDAEAGIVDEETASEAFMQAIENVSEQATVHYPMLEAARRVAAYHGWD